MEKNDHAARGREKKTLTYNPDILSMCYSCGKEGHIYRECKFSLKNLYKLVAGYSKQTE